MRWASPVTRRTYASHTGDPNPAVALSAALCAPHGPQNQSASGTFWGDEEGGANNESKFQG
jgi:hypothetical protein